MEKWVRRKLNFLYDQLAKQEKDLNIARTRGDEATVARLERELAATKADMVRAVGG